MADTGWVEGVTAAVYDNGEVWSNPSYILTQNDSPATVSVPSIKFSWFLSMEAFTFGIPAGSTINGVEVEIDAYASSHVCLTEGMTMAIYLHKSGVAAGAQKSEPCITALSDTDTYFAYGGAADMWGTGYDQDDIEDSGFGVFIRAGNLGVTRTLSVDHIRMKITYTPPPGYGNDVNDVPAANIGSINDVPTANIATVNDI